MERKKKNLKALTLLLAFIMVFTAAITIWPGDDSAFGARRKNNLYSLSGAKYQLYTNSACTTQAKDVNGSNAVLTTDANGNSNTLTMDQGTYYAKEVTAGAGYRLDTKVYTVNVTDGGTATFTSAEPPAYGVPNFNVYKFDAEGEYGWSKLSGAEFTVKYYDVANKADIASSEPLDTWNFKTRKMQGSVSGSYMAGFDFDSDEPLEGSSPFYVVDGKRVIPIGWFTIQETNAPEGLALNDTVYYGQVKQTGNGSAGTVTIEGATSSGDLKVPVSVTDDPQGISIAIKKESANEVENPLPVATLAGAKYEVYYDGQTGKKLVGTLVTDVNGNTNDLTEDLDGKALKPGVYYVKEVKASPGYLLDKYRIREDGQTTYEWSGTENITCTYQSNGQTITKTVEGSFQNGEHKVNAQIQTTNTSVFKYTFTSKEPYTEPRMSKIDAHSERPIPGSVLQVLDDHGKVIAEWTSKGKDEVLYGIPSGTYILHEVSAPLGYDVADDAMIEISDNKIVNRIEFKNIPIEMGTTAIDNSTGTHQGIMSATEVIKDTVNIQGLWRGRTYKVKGKLYNKTTGELLKDKTGKVITAESDPFTATSTSMDVEIFFNVDASEFSTDMAVVVFESLYRVDDTEEVEIAKHEDPEDEDQTVVYGGIVETEATDAKSSSHNVLGDKGAVVKDTVKYENLAVGTTYTLEGELYDKTTGELTGIKAKTTFKPETPNGTVDVEFKFDATEYKGHKLVAYETLLVHDIEVNKHEDPDDEDQTVNVPDVETIAVNPACNEHIGNAGKLTIKDTVKYSNLIPGKTYTVEGTLQYRDGLFNTLHTVMNGDKPLTAKAAFTPDEEDGTVEVTFTFDASNLEGKTVVVFEDLYEGEYKIATHADPDDEDQSVHIPEIGTKVGKKVDGYVVDTVFYKNLVPGKTYVVRGYAVKQKTGEKVDGFVGETKFTPTAANGAVDVKLKNVEGSGNVVIFEECFIVTDDGETLVGEHKDLNDEDQLFKKQGKIIIDDKDKLKMVNTGDDNVLALWISLFTVEIALLLVIAIRIHRKRKKEERDILA